LQELTALDTQTPWLDLRGLLLRGEEGKEEEGRGGTRRGMRKGKRWEGIAGPSPCVGMGPPNG